MKKLVYPLFGLFFALAGLALAAGETSIQWGMTPGADPRSVCIFDTGHTCVPIGTVNNTTHTFAMPYTSVTGLGTAATQNTGTSGATLPFLNASNIWSVLQTFTSGWKISVSGAAANGVIAGDAGQSRAVIFNTGSSNRWSISANPTAEAGANAGSDLTVSGYGDTGTLLGNYLKIFRASGGVNVGSPTGGDQGAGTLNAAGIYVNGVPALTGPPWPVIDVSRAPYNAVGDGSDETAKIQSAINAAGTFSVVLLQPGKTYGVTNLVFPTPTGGGSYNYGPSFMAIGGKATLLRLAGGNTDYLAANKRWVTGDVNAAFSDSPWRFNNIVFDCASICKFDLVLKSWAPRVEDCVFRGATDTGLLFTRQNQDASNGTTGYQSDAKFLNNRFEGNTLYGLRSQGTAALAYDASTDASLIGNVFNGGQYGLYLANTGGWQVVNNRTFSQTVAGASFNALRRGQLIAHNNFDGTAIQFNNTGGGASYT
ncbi:MAG: hypothetical protein KGP14_03330, partial [Betaproteobacteria bacterium]|nr:hypothetical protein [Betaproteobacteria bacterium]